MRVARRININVSEVPITCVCLKISTRIGFR